MNFDALLIHPDNQEIITMMLTGSDAKTIAQWLKIKYPDKKELHLTAKMLDEYNKSHLNLMDQLKKDVAIVKENGTNLTNKKLSESLLNNKTYQEKLIENVDKEIDIKKTMKDLIIVIQTRVEQCYNTIMLQINNNPTQASFKGDYILIKYLELLMNTAEKFDKIVNGTPDQIVRHDININIINSYKIAFQESIRRTLEHLDNESSLLFVEHLSEELAKVEMPIEFEMSQEKKENELKLISDKISAIIE